MNQRDPKVKSSRSFIRPAMFDFAVRVDGRGRGVGKGERKGERKGEKSSLR